MNERREFGELFAGPLVRHSLELASTLWGVTVCVLDNGYRAHFPAIAPPAVVELTNALLTYRKTRAEIELHLSTLFVASPDWIGPRWFQPLDGVRLLVTPVGSATGTTFLLCVPLVLYAESEAAEHGALADLSAQLRGLTVPNGADQVPALSTLERRKLQTHMSTLGREMDLLISRVTRRAGDLVRKPDSYPGLIGNSQATQDLKNSLKVLAGDDTPLLLTGELGAGKRTICHSLHALSNRKSAPYLVIDCESTPPSALMTTLLGRGWRYGTIPELEKVAGAGTVVFLEVGYLPPVFQHLLLNYYDAWDGPNLPAFRMIATSTLSPEGLSRLCTLKPELVALLRANVLQVPALRRRKDDLPAIAQDMLLRLRAVASDYPMEFSNDVLRVFQSYDWPGNLWELKGEIRYSAGSARGRQQIQVQNLSQRIIAHTTQKREEPEAEQWVLLPEAVENLERSMLMEALNATRWNRSRTARLLGISRRNLIRKITRYQLDRRKKEMLEPTPEQD